MRISVVNLTSDSSDAETEVANRTTLHEKSLHKFFCEKKQSAVEQRVPLFKIIFKDESTSRIYKRRLEVIAKNLVAAKLTEDNEFNSSGLVLEIYEPTENFNVTAISDSKEVQNPVIDYSNPNNTSAFSQDSVLPTAWFDQTNQQTSFSDAPTWIAQPRVQQFILRPQSSPPVNMNVNKRKSTDDSELSSLRKKVKVEYESGSSSQFQNETDKFTCTRNKNPSKNLHYDPVWYNSSNTQNSAAITLEPQHYDPVWYDSNNVSNEPAGSMSTEKPNDLGSQAENMRSSLEDKNKSVMHTYRVLKIGSHEFSKKRTITLSKDGIQLVAPHLNNASTVVKLNILMANVVKIQACFSNILPAIFIHVNKNAAAVIREALGINKDNVASFDPESTDDTCNKIIVLPDCMPENGRVLKHLIQLGLVTVLNEYSSQIILLNSFSKVLRRKNKQFSSNLSLNVKSQTVRIGTYKSNMKLDVNISTNGFQFQIPKVGDDEIFKKIIIGFEEIDKLYFCLQKCSAVFIHVNSLCAQRIRSLLEMPETNNGGVYFDPDSATIAEQRLIIVFNKINHSSRQEILLNLLSYTHAAELTLQKIIHQMLYSHI